LKNLILKILNVEANVSGYIKERHISFLRVTLGVIYIWFGLLKPFGISPAASLASDTMPFLPQDFFIFSLGVWEVIIGLCFLFKPLTRLALVLFFVHIPGTFLPMFILPHSVYTNFPFGITLEGQYIIKNLALISVVLVIWLDYVGKVSLKKKKVPIFDSPSSEMATNEFLLTGITDEDITASISWLVPSESAFPKRKPDFRDFLTNKREIRHSIKVPMNRGRFVEPRRSKRL